MNNLRRHDSAVRAPIISRSDRLYSTDGLWYFKTREGSDVGPFRYRSEAQAGLSLFLDRFIEADRAALEAKRDQRAKPRFRLAAAIADSALKSPYEKKQAV